MLRSVPLWTLLLGVGTAVLLAPARAEACSCFPVTVESGWHNSTDTFAGTVLGVQTVGQTVTYKVQVNKVFGGCTTKNKRVFLDTPLDAASCGQTLTVGQKYLITANDTGGPNLSITSCGFNREVSTLTVDEKDFLNSRQVFCPDTGATSCADGSIPVNCFVDPCTVETCSDPAGVCEANYCGGCNAEFFDPSGEMVCPP